MRRVKPGDDFEIEAAENNTWIRAAQNSRGSNSGGAGDGGANYDTENILISVYNDTDRIIPRYGILGLGSRSCTGSWGLLEKDKHANPPGVEKSIAECGRTVEQNSWQAWQFYTDSHSFGDSTDKVFGTGGPASAYSVVSHDTEKRHTFNGIVPITDSFQNSLAGFTSFRNGTGQNFAVVQERAYPGKIVNAIISGLTICRVAVQYIGRSAALITRDDDTDGLWPDPAALSEADIGNVQYFRGVSPAVARVVAVVGHSWWGAPRLYGWFNPLFEDEEIQHNKNADYWYALIKICSAVTGVSDRRAFGYVSGNLTPDVSRCEFIAYYTQDYYDGTTIAAYNPGFRAPWGAPVWAEWWPNLPSTRPFAGVVPSDGRLGDWVVYQTACGTF